MYVDIDSRAVSVAHVADADIAAALIHSGADLGIASTTIVIFDDAGCCRHKSVP